MTNNVNIVPWTSTFLEKTVAMYIDVFSAEPWNDLLTEPQITGYVTALMEMNTFLGYGLLNKETNELLGYAIGFVKPWYQGTEYVIDTFLIASDHQSQGLGSSFIRLIEEELRQKGIPTILLDTETAMPAFQFYAKNGFKPLPDNVTLYRSID
ncbi:GNAT family N-acetyltransferase [Enterococcus sp. DIV0876]|uniref:GNAT family N-acetyltransferase n=1 Tax=Enterococcus sp. DIV0876 TaxID=2774633 RepID=UPI003D2FAEA9